MASTSTQIVSSSSFSSTSPQRYDVFLSFYGKDTRKSFTDHLYAALIQKGIIVFRDNEKLERGKYISKELLKAIQETMYAIAVISPNYASSRWCLIELAKIVECMRDTRLTILPIFYHVDPSHVRNQTGTFAEAFDRHEKDPKVDVDDKQKWRGALKEVGSISGWHIHDSHEAKVVEEISRMIFRGLVNFLNVSKGLVGIESRAEEIMSKLCIGLDDVLFLGIHGMGGIGKTALSKFIYERVSHQFEASCFIASIREETRTGYGLVYLQKQLISEILRDREINIWNSYGAINVIANRLCNKKVFIVLDDVDGEKQLKELAESHDWFGQGSRIIITSRDRHLLNRFVDKTYEVNVLNIAEALQLFCRKAFKKPHPEENYVQLSMDIVKYAQGLPLALEVFGSFLFGRKMDFWKKARDVLKEKPNVEILDILKISFSGLNSLQQELFLDIACFFDEAFQYRIIHKLESFGYDPIINIEILVDKSLITISEDELQMHNLLRKMGQKIVHDESAEPGKRSRLCDDNDIIHVLKNDTGTDVVKGIVLNLPLKKPERLNVEAFSKMVNLKMLVIRSYYSYKKCDKLRMNLEWYGDLSNFMLSNELCVMEWWGYPFEYLPTNFQSDNLVELIMYNSCIKQLWVGRNSLDKLKHIDLSGSQNLIETPDLSEVPNLEILELKDCTSLSKVHPSIRFLGRLKRLNLHGCNLSNGAIPSDLSCLSSLKDLNLSRNKFTRIPYSAWQLSNLGNLDLRYCNLLDGAIPNDLSCLPSLFFLGLSGNKFTRIPDSVAQLSNLLILVLDHCSWLQVLPKLPLRLAHLSVRNCPLLELFYKQMEMWRTSNEKVRSIDCSFVQAYIDYDGKPFKILRLHPQSPLWKNSEYHGFEAQVACGHALVGSGILEWFNDKSTSLFGTNQVHTDLGSDEWWEWNWKGYALFIFYEFHDERKGNSNSTTFDGTHPNIPYFVCQFQANGVNVGEPLVLCAPGVPYVGPNGLWVYIPAWWFIQRRVRNRILGGWRSLKVSITTSSLNAEVKECGARVERDEHDERDIELYQLLNTISPRGLCLKSYENLFSHLKSWPYLDVKGPIIMKSNVVASGSIGSANLSASFEKKQKVFI